MCAGPVRERTCSTRQVVGPANIASTQPTRRGALPPDVSGAASHPIARGRHHVSSGSEHVRRPRSGGRSGLRPGLATPVSPRTCPPNMAAGPPRRRVHAEAVGRPGACPACSGARRPDALAGWRRHRTGSDAPVPSAYEDPPRVFVSWSPEPEPARRAGPRAGGAHRGRVGHRDRRRGKRPGPLA